MRTNIYIILALWLYGFAPVNAGNIAEQDSLIFLRTHVGQRVIKLRWAPADKYIWKDALKNGYRVTRKTIMRHGELLDHPEVIILKEQALPAAPEAWKEAMLRDPMSAVVAQAVFGTHFETSGGGEENDPAQMIMEADDLTKRYAFSLYACDMSYTAAELSGLAFTDHTIDRHEAYIYEVEQLSQQKLPLVKASRFVRASDSTVLPKPQPPAAVASDSIVTLSWNYLDMAETYSAYFLERSSDGTFFKSLGETPVTALSGDPSGNIDHTDVPGATGTFWYRLRGIDVFGETGPPSESFKVQILPPFLTTARITGFRSLPNGKVSLSWEVGKATGTSVKELEVLSAMHPKGDYVQVKKGISAHAKNVVISQREAVVYYKLRTVDAFRRSNESTSFMVQLPDTIPPGTPVDIKAITFKKEEVRLSWTSLSDKDLIGYDVYFAPTMGAEFSRLNRLPIATSEYAYPLKEKNSLRQARFFVRAVDERFNESPPSDTVHVHFSTPPIAPVIRSYQYRKDSGLALGFVTGPGAEKGMVRVYRQDRTLALSEKWKLLSEFRPGRDSIFIDSEVNSGETYRYIMTVKDILGQESDPSAVITFSAPEHNPTSAGGKITLLADREYRAIQLHWDLEWRDLMEIRLYRRSGQHKLSLYKTFAPDRRNFTDTGVVPNTTYGYLLVAIYPKGTQRALDEEHINF